MNSPGNFSSDEQLARLSEQVRLQASAYEAMAEVYEKYSLALARIMELLRQVNDTVKDSDRVVDKHFTDIITCVTVLGESIKHAEEAVRVEHAAFLQRFNDLNVAIDRACERIDKIEDDISELRIIVKEFHDAMAQTTSSTLVMVKQVYEQQKVSVDFWRRWRMWLYAFLGFLAVIETLIQFGIVSITWFQPK